MESFILSRTARAAAASAVLLAAACLAAAGDAAPPGHRDSYPSRERPPSLSGGATPPPTWAQWRGGPRRSGAVGDAPVLPRLARGACLVEAWRSEALPDGYGHQRACVVGQGSPVVRDGKVYLYVNWPDPNSVKVLKGPVRIPERVFDAVLCLDLANGRTLWKAMTPGKPWRWGISSTPAVAEGAVVVVGSTGDGICLDAATGKERWRWRNPKPPKPSYTNTIGPWHASALIHEGKAVFIGAGKTIVACDLADGAARWSRAVRGRNRWSSPAAWPNGGSWTLLAGGCLLDPTDGSVLWPGSRKAKGGWHHGWCTPAVEKDRAAAMGGKGLLVARLTRDGPHKIADIELENGGGSAAISDRRVYACGARVVGSDDKGKLKRVGHVVCVDAVSGKTLWDTVCPKLRVGGQWSFVSVAVGSGVVCILDDRAIHLLRAADGELLRSPINVDVLKGGVSPALVGDHLITRGWKAVVCYRAEVEQRERE